MSLDEPLAVYLVVPWVVRLALITVALMEASKVEKKDEKMVDLTVDSLVF